MNERRERPSGAGHWAEAFAGARRTAYFGVRQAPRSWTSEIDLGTEAVVFDLGDELDALLDLAEVRAGLRVAISTTAAPRDLIEAIRGRATLVEIRVEGVEVRFLGETGSLSFDAPVLELTEAQLSATRELARRREAELLGRIAKSAESQRERIAALSKEIEEIKQRIGSIERSRRFRLAHAIALASRSPMDALRLPKRISRLYGETAERPSAAPKGDRRRALEDDLARFIARIETRRPKEIVLMVSGTTFIQPIRANRPIRLARLLLDRGIPTFFSYHGSLDEKDRPAFRHELLFEGPIDFFEDVFARIARSDLGASDRVLVVSYPHLSIARQVGVFDAEGWATVYDCRDDWEEFHRAGAADWYSPSIERFVVNNCDATFCVSRPLAAKMQSLTNRAVEVSPNAYDPSFLSPSYERQPAAEVRVGYFGHLTERWFDWRSLGEIAMKRPNIRFEIIGHGKAPAHLPSNVVVLGPKTHAEICVIAKAWRAAIIPFRMGALADAVDPIKIYEYFALGLPVVSFRMPQIADYPHTATVSSADAFVVALDHAVETPVDVALLRAFLARNTWSHRLDQILGRAHEVLRRAPVEKTFSSEGPR